MKRAGPSTLDAGNITNELMVDTHDPCWVVNGFGRIQERRRVAALAAAARLPAIYGARDHVTDGGLISYGVSLSASARHLAVYVDKLLKGARPDDLPVEFPSRLELVINLKTAKVLGLTIPPTLLARADEVIE
jgi:putative ABC transport system substrate-binding protein